MFASNSHLLPNNFCLARFALKVPLKSIVSADNSFPDLPI